MDKTQASAALEQQRQILLRLLAEAEQQHAQVQTEQQSLTDWQQVLRHGLDYWAWRGHLLTQLTALLPAEPLPDPAPDWPGQLVQMREDLARDRVQIDALMPQLLRAESQVSSLLVLVEQVSQGWEIFRQSVLDLYEQTRG